MRRSWNEVEVGVLHQLAGSPEVVLQQVEAGRARCLEDGSRNLLTQDDARLEIFRIHLEYCGIVFLGYDQGMPRVNGPYVQEAQNPVVFVDSGTRDFSLNDLAEDTIGHLFLLSFRFPTDPVDCFPGLFPVLVAFIVVKALLVAAPIAAL